MASARLKEGALALGVAAVLIGAIAVTGAPAWLGWVAAGVAVLLAEVAGRLWWREPAP